MFVVAVVAVAVEVAVVVGRPDGYFLFHVRACSTLSFAVGRDVGVVLLQM